MSIHALPATTVRAIGASQVLTDPAALVKELIDNSLDARATIVSVEISANTIDTIQVRDNGHGIAPLDRSMVARRYCTSKISGEEDLNTIGGSSLGFRGEALSSAAEQSGSMTVSTRVEGEEVAAILKISRAGEVIAREHGSISAGTIVKLTDFIKANPVRRQMALKNADKCLKKIKQTLQTYAFVRPHVRLSLKVLKAKTEKANFLHAPTVSGTAEDVALKIVGSVCVQQCTWSVLEQEGFVLQAFLPRADADVSKISNFGSFISVDGRPVSGARGTSKQIIKIFRESLKQASASSDTIKEPFFYLDIQCPVASYDANVEPAKDDVLFEDPEKVLDAMRALLKAVYSMAEKNLGTTKRTRTIVQPHEAGRPVIKDDEDDFVTSLETQVSNKRSRAEEEIDFDQLEDGERELLSEIDVSAATTDRPVKRQRTFRPNMYGCDEEDLEMLDERPTTGRTDADFEELRQAQKDINVNNPWILAKMNASIRRPLAEHEGALQVTSPACGESNSRLPSYRQTQGLSGQVAPGLMTPRPSSPSPNPVPFHGPLPDLSPSHDVETIGPTSSRQPQMYSPTPSSLPDQQSLSPVRGLLREPEYNYHLTSEAVELPAETPLSAIPDVSARQRRSPVKQPRQPRLNRPFVSPIVNGPLRERVWFDHLESPASRAPQASRRPRTDQRTLVNNGLVVQGELGDLVEDPRPLTPPRRNRDIRDFVRSGGTRPQQTAASLIENRNYPPQSKRIRASSLDSVDFLIFQDEDHELQPAKRVKDFQRASELPPIESDTEPPKKALHPPRRRRTSEGRALTEVSGNGDVPDEEENQPLTAKRAVSRRRRTTDGGPDGIHRTKSSRLPLERVPKNKSMHSVLLNLSITGKAVSRGYDKIIEKNTFLDWNQPATDAYNTFAVPFNPNEMECLTASLRHALINRVSDAEMVQDLAVLVEDAIATQYERSLESTAIPAVQ